MKSRVVPSIVVTVVSEFVEELGSVVEDESSTVEVSCGVVPSVVVSSSTGASVVVVSTVVLS